MVLNNYYSFNLCKNGSKIRLIISINEIEEESADKQAYNWMIDDKYYNSIINNQNYDISKENVYPKSFVVYRLAQDNIINYSSNEYQKYNILLNIK